MSRLISDILSAPEPAFSHLIEQWENLSGRNGIDVRLGVEVLHSLQNLLRELGLDAHDTTAKELYRILCLRSLEDSKKLAKHIGVNSEDSPSKAAEKIVRYLYSLELPRSVWSVKNSVLKQYLRAQPPKKLMKLNGQRSIDSVIKREPCGMLLALSFLTEQSDWAAKLHARYKNLRVSDFDEHDVNITVISFKQAAALRKGGFSLNQLVLTAREAGDIVVIPPAKRFDGDVLLIINSIIESLREQRLYSIYYRIMSTQPKFGDNILQILEKGLKTASEETIGTNLSTLHNLALRSDRPLIQDIGPGLSDEDLQVPDTAAVLAEHIPEFNFWLRPLAAKVDTGGLVSCHISDVIINASSGMDYDRRTAYYLQSALWDEFCARYLQAEPIARQTLNNDMIF